MKIRSDLSFDECTVVELKFDRKKIFFTVLYRSTTFKHTSVEFENFFLNFKTLYSNIKKEKPYMSFFTGDFNATLKTWYPTGKSKIEVTKIANLLTTLGLHQIIDELMNFETLKKGSCIDLIITDQPNLILDSGTQTSPDNLCHRQVLHCKVNFGLPSPHPYEREIWHYPRANVELLKISMSIFP